MKDVPGREEEERKREQAEEGVLPEVRTLVARKERGGVTVVRSDD